MAILYIHNKGYVATDGIKLHLTDKANATDLSFNYLLQLRKRFPNDTATVIGVTANQRLIEWEC